MVARLWRNWRNSASVRAVWGWVFNRLSFDASPDSQLDAADATTVRDFDLLVGQRSRGPAVTSPADRVPRAWIISFILLAAIYIATSGIPKLFDEIDGQYAGAAREMMENGNWIIPTQNGVPRLQKPPFVYWCEILSFSILGKNEFAARFPVALATVAWFAATGLVARRAIGTSSAGAAAAITLAVFAGSFFFCHLVMPEPFIGCFTTLSFWAVLGALHEKPSETFRRGRWLLAAWVFIALGCLSKGLHALLFPVVAISATAWVKPSIRPVWKRFLFRPYGWVLFFAVLAPWYAVIEARYPGFLRDHFLNEQLGPALSRRWPPDSDRVPLLVFWLQHLALFFPITLLFPAALGSAYRFYKSERKEVSAEALLLFFWFLANALGISFANVQDYYLMAAWPPVAIGVAWAISERGIDFKRPALVLAAFGILGLLTSVWLAVRHMHHKSEFATSIDPQLVDKDTILIVFQSLPPSAWTRAIPLLFMVFGTALVAGVLVYIFCRKGKSHLGLAGFALSMSAIFLFSTRGLAIVQDDFSSAKVAAAVNRMAEPGCTVVVQGDSNEKTSLFFYLHHSIYWVDGHPDLEFATRALGIGRGFYLSRADFTEKWHGAGQVFLIVQSSAVEEWKTVLADSPPNVAGVFGPQTILVNHKNTKSVRSLAGGTASVPSDESNAH
jgi:4-amino-4-deoxy-L-arabinose transferase-like glycosyltransferase